MTARSVRPDDIRLDPLRLAGRPPEPDDVERLLGMARRMIAACDGPEGRRPGVVELDARDEPGMSFISIHHDRETLGIVSPLPTPEGRDASPYLRMVVRACEAIRTAPVGDADGAKSLVSTVFLLAQVGAVAMASGAIGGGTGCLAHGPSPFGPAFLVEDRRGGPKRAEFALDLPTLWTAGVHLPQADMACITLRGVTHEPDAGDEMDSVETMRQIARLGLGPMLDAMRGS